MKHGLLITFCFSILLMIAGIIISTSLPRWLGSSDDIYKNAYLYILVYVCSLPVQQVNVFSSLILQSSGNIFQLFTPDMQVQKLATKVLRIELLAEPLYAVSIIASGSLRGAEDTFIPSLLNLFSIWCIRLFLSLLLVNDWGLIGVWFAMAVEL